MNDDTASLLGVGPSGRQRSVSPGKVVGPAGVGKASDRAWRTAAGGRSIGSLWTALVVP
jgi:hypothetical protein